MRGLIILYTKAKASKLFYTYDIFVFSNGVYVYAVQLPFKHK